MIYLKGLFNSVTLDGWTEGGAEGRKEGMYIYFEKKGREESVRESALEKTD